MSENEKKRKVDGMMKLQMENYQEIEIESVSSMGKVLDKMMVMVCDGDLYIQGKELGAVKVQAIFQKRKR